MAAGLEFGTDGVRALVGNEPMTYEGAQQFGRATVAAFGLRRSDVLVAGDTRGSTAELIDGIADGIASMNANAVVVRNFPTPGAAIRARDSDVEAAAVVTASHNPHSLTDPNERWNGYKVFGTRGDKIIDNQVAELTTAFKSDLSASERRGRIYDGVAVRSFHTNAYRDHLAKAVDYRLVLLDQRVGIDTAHGAAHGFAYELAYSAGAKDVKRIGDNPDGYNINDGVGATHMKAISQLVKQESLDLGAAFDGDADRCLMVDRFGRVIDGDMMAYLGTLTGLHQHVALSIMANEGVVQAIQEHGVKVTRTPVGDRYLLQARAENAETEQPVTLGAEQSGHVIFNDEPSGDGMLTFLRTVEASEQLNLPLNELYDDVKKLLFPQKLVSPRVSDRARAMSHPAILACVAEVDDRLRAAGGRSVFRESGTGNEIRLLAEAPRSTNGLVTEVTDKFLEVVAATGLRVA